MTDIPLRRVETRPDAVYHHADPGQQIATFAADLDGSGIVIFHHAQLLVPATMDGRDVIFLAQKACPCGCGAPGRGLVWSPSVEHLRSLSTFLAETADRREAEAAASAAAALAKAARR